MLMHPSNVRHRIFRHARNKEGKTLNSGCTKEIERQITPLRRCLEGNPPPADQQCISTLPLSKYGEIRGMATRLRVR